MPVAPSLVGVWVLVLEDNPLLGLEWLLDNRCVGVGVGVDAGAGVAPPCERIALGVDVVCNGRMVSRCCAEDAGADGVRRGVCPF